MKALLTTFARILIFCLFGVLILSSGRVAVAAEGAFSNYFPGAYGTVAVATPPKEGWTSLNTSIFYAADAEQAVLQERLPAGLEGLLPECSHPALCFWYLYHQHRWRDVTARGQPIPQLVQIV